VLEVEKEEEEEVADQEVTRKMPEFSLKEQSSIESDESFSGN